MDDYNNLTTSGNKIQIWSCDGKAQQKWVLMRDNTLRIHGKCLGVSAASTLAGAAAVLSSCKGTASQQWLVGPAGEFINANSGECLADPGDSTVNGTALRQADCYGLSGEIWAPS